MLAYALISLALFLKHGFFSIKSFALLVGGLILLFSPEPAELPGRKAVLATCLLFIALHYFEWTRLIFETPYFMQLLRKSDFELEASAMVFFFTLNTLLLYSFYQAFREPSFKGLSFNTLSICLVLLALATALTLFSPPPIEIYDFLMGSGKILLKGRNPYQAHYPNIYYSTSYAELFRNPYYARPTFDVFGYLPGLFPVTILGYLLGDIRYLFLAFHLAIFLLVGFLLKKRHLAYLYFFNPIHPYLLIYGFVDVYSIFFIALLIFALLNKGTKLTTASLLGIFLSKQYALFLPFFLLSHLPKKCLLKALLLSSLIYLFFLIWDCEAFLHDVIFYHVSLKRIGGISLPAFLNQFFSFKPHAFTITSFFLLFLSGFLAFREKKLSASLRFIAKGYFLFFFFSKTAFINYYYFALSLWLFSFIGREKYFRPLSS